MGRLDGKVAVITGATSGIGLRTAEIFVAEGAKIVIAGRRAPEGEALATRLGANCIFRQTDVTVEAQMKALIALSVEKFGRIDCLFNNAGGPAQTGGIEGLEVERFDAAMATLVRSVMLGMKHAAPYMRKQGSGSIINNGSIAGRLFIIGGLWRGESRRHPSHQMRGNGVGRSQHPRQLDFSRCDRDRHLRQGARPAGGGGGKDVRRDA
jgi:NAD(P)-dependent dehydrogenase (short-subunit alcohol dehydrogenase family)